MPLTRNQDAALLLACSSALAVITVAAGGTVPVGIIVGLVVFCSLFTLNRSMHALRDKAASNLEILLLWLLASFAWYVFLLVFPDLVAGTAIQWTPKWYFWVGPAAVAVYALLYRERRRRGVSVEF